VSSIWSFGDDAARRAARKRWWQDKEWIEEYLAQALIEAQENKGDETNAADAMADAERDHAKALSHLRHFAGGSRCRRQLAHTSARHLPLYD
jgi:uncharacterized protein (DUF2342 family)